MIYGSTQLALSRSSRCTLEGALGSSVSIAEAMRSAAAALSLAPLILGKNSPQPISNLAWQCRDLSVAPTATAQSRLGIAKAAMADGMAIMPDCMIADQRDLVAWWDEHVREIIGLR